MIRTIAIFALAAPLLVGAAACGGPAPFGPPPGPYGAPPAYPGAYPGYAPAAPAYAPAAPAYAPMPTYAPSRCPTCGQPVGSSSMPNAPMGSSALAYGTTTYPGNVPAAAYSHTANPGQCPQCQLAAAYGTQPMPH